MGSVLPQEIEQEIQRFDATAKEFLAGKIPADKFQRFRLQHGVYGQRQDGVQMIRLKIPLGRLNSEQIECVADLAEKIAHNNAHITTRQDIQIHYVKLANVAMLMRRLAEVGLTTREACGNTVRNVTAAPSAGVDPKEPFDVTPYAHAFATHMLRNPICQNLGRKFKVAFDGDGVFTAYPKVHDIGLIARIRATNGHGERGFQVYVGGGLGSSARIGKLLHEFLPVEELLPWGEAILRVFDRYGERKVRMKARMKFLVEKAGFDQFRKWLEEERASLVVPPEWNDYLDHLDDWIETPPVVDEQSVRKAPETPEFVGWKKTNVWPQKQSGFSMVEIRLSTGDIVPNQMRPFAKILRRYAGGQCRTMVHQNLLIRWVGNRDLPGLYQELKEIGLVKKDAQTIYDVTACPGTDTCRLGIASSMGLARVIEERLYKEDGQITACARDLRIKISGCPNSCGQHHIANIGLYGGAFPMNGHTAPAFQLMLGGTFGQDSVIATPICQVPSKNVPDAIVRLVRNYAQNRKGQESFNAFYGRLGKEAAMQLLGDLLKVPMYSERPDFYVDWEDQKEFALQKGVIGECAGQMVEDRPPLVSDGDEPLKMAEALLDHGEFESAAYKAYEAIQKAANGLLYYRLVQTFNDIETTHEFENHFVRTGTLPQFVAFHQKVQGLRHRSHSEETGKEWVALATTVLQACHAKEPEVKAASPRKGKPAGPQPDFAAI